jgi:hypothetical protein
MQEPEKGYGKASRKKAGLFTDNTKKYISFVTL